MNERIKELAVEAGAYLREGYAEQANGDSVWTKDVRVDHCDMDLQRFAELIVRECMYVGRHAQITNQLVDAEIKEHFRV